MLHIRSFRVKVLIIRLIENISVIVDNFGTIIDQVLNDIIVIVVGIVIAIVHPIVDIIVVTVGAGGRTISTASRLVTDVVVLNFSNNLRNTIKRHCKIIPSRICRTNQAYI